MLPTGEREYEVDTMRRWHSWIRHTLTVLVVIPFLIGCGSTKNASDVAYGDLLAEDPGEAAIFHTL